MPYDPSGNFSRLHSWQADRDAGIRILADRHDEEDDNFASAFNIAFLRTGTVPMTGDLTMSGNAIRTVGAGSAANPSLTFELSPRTGLYQVNPTTIGFSSNGVDIFDVNGTGVNVNGGITATGDLTSTGNASLGHVVTSNGDSSAEFRMVSSGGKGWRIIETSTPTVVGDLHIQSTGDNFTTATDDVVVTSTGRMGIATASPNDRLDVVGSVLISDGSFVYSGYDGGSYTGGIRSGIQCDGHGQNLSFFTNNASRGYFDVNGLFAVNGQNATINGGRLLLNHDGSNGYIRTQGTWGGLYLGANGANNMVLESGGDTQIFHNLYTGTLAGSTTTGIEVGNARSADGASYIDFHGTVGTDFDARLIRNAGVNGSFDMRNVGGGTFNLSSDALISFNAGSGNPQRMTIDANGNVTMISATVKQVSDNGASLNLTASGRGYRWLNTSAGVTLGRLVLQATNDNFATVTSIGICYDTNTSSWSPEANNGLNLGDNGRRWANVYTANVNSYAEIDSGTPTGGSGGFKAYDRSGNGYNWMLYPNNSALYLWNAQSNERLVFTNTMFGPNNDAGMNLGDASHRMNSYWGLASTIQTSDAREKKWRGGLNEYEVAAAKELVKEIGIYQWLRDLEKGGDQAKMQCGITAQKAIAIFHSHGLDAFDYGFVRFDEWDESEHTNLDGSVVVNPGGNRYSIMFPDILAFMMVGQEQRLDALEAKVEYLSGYGKRSDP
jgi:hypothetical protein